MTRLSVTGIIGSEEDAEETHDEEKEDQEEEDVIPNFEIDDENGEDDGLSCRSYLLNFCTHSVKCQHNRSSVKIFHYWVIWFI